MKGENSNPAVLEPVYGKEYMLVERIGGAQLHGFLRDFKGVFIGCRPNETGEFLSVEYPEGFLFAAKDGEGQISIYMQRSDVLREMWLSEGDDGPSWPEGIEVYKFDGK